MATSIPLPLIGDLGLQETAQFHRIMAKMLQNDEKITTHRPCFAPQRALARDQSLRFVKWGLTFLEHNCQRLRLGIKFCNGDRAIVNVSLKFVVDILGQNGSRIPIQCQRSIANQETASEWTSYLQRDLYMVHKSSCIPDPTNAIVVHTNTEGRGSVFRNIFFRDCSGRHWNALREPLLSYHGPPAPSNHLDKVWTEILKEMDGVGAQVYIETAAGFDTTLLRNHEFKFVRWCEAQDGSAHDTEVGISKTLKSDMQAWRRLIKKNQKYLTSTEIHTELATGGA